MKQVDVTIMGHGYRLGCEEGGEAELMRAVAAVDRVMCTIRDAGRVKARDRIAVLAALKLATPSPLNGEAAVGPTGGGSPAARAQESSDTSAAADRSRDGGAAHADAVLDALIVRLDAALGDDGQLL